MKIIHHVFAVLFIVSGLFLGKKILSFSHKVPFSIHVGRTSFAEEPSPEKEEVSKENVSEVHETLDFDPFSVSAAQEIQFLRNLASRSEEIKKRKAELNKQESIMIFARKQIQESIDKLKKIQEEIRKTVDNIDKDEEKKFKHLVAMFENMKPKKASLVFNQMDIKTLKKLFKSMNGKKLSLIANGMNPDVVEKIGSQMINQINPFARNPVRG